MTKYYFFFLVFFALSCKKKGTVSGYVVHAITGEEMKNVPISVYRTVNSSRLFAGSNIEALSNSTTDNSGRVNFNLTYKKKEVYFIGIPNAFSSKLGFPTDTGASFIENYWLNLSEFNSDLSNKVTIDDQSFFNVVFKVIPAACLIIKFKDIPPLNNNQIFDLTINGIDPQNGIMGIDDTTGRAYSVPMPKEEIVKVRWRLNNYLTSSVADGTDSVRIEPFKKSYITIRY